MVVSFALAFGPAEYFSLMVLAFVMVSAVLGSSSVRGLTSLFVGFFLGMIGVDLQTGQPRFTFGITELLDGVDVIVVAVGLFAVGETLYVASRRYAGKDEIVPLKGSLYMTAAGMGSLMEGLDPRRVHRLPDRRDAGRRRRDSDLPFLCDREEALETQGRVRHHRRHRRRCRTGSRQQRLRRRRAGAHADAWPADFGHRRDHAVGLPELRHQPRPAAAHRRRPSLVWGLIASLFIANVILVVLNLPLIGLWVRLLKIPAPQLYAGILVFATVGTYGISQSPIDLVLLYLLGGLGFLMRRFDFPTAPVIIGMILGPMAETQFRRAMTISNGDWSVFYTHPLSLTLLSLALLALLASAHLQLYPASPHARARTCAGRCLIPWKRMPFRAIGIPLQLFCRMPAYEKSATFGLCLGEHK